MLFRERQQTMICVAAAAIVVGFLLFRYLPLQRRIKVVEQARASQRLAITRASAQSAQLPVLKEQLRKLEKTVEDYEANIPGQRDLGVFLQRIADLMNKHNLKDQLVQPGEEIETEELHCIPVSVQCKGGLKQIFGFFKSLQLLDRLVRIGEVRLINDKDFSGEVSVQAETIIYYRPKGEQV